MKKGGAVSKASPAVVGSTTTTTTSATLAHKDADNDNDNPSGSRYDEDDYAVLLFGEPATAAESRELTLLIRSYYMAARAYDGASACRMIYSKLANSAVGDFGAPSGLSGKTCASLMTQLLERDRRELQPIREVRDIRVEGDHASAMLRFASMSDRHAMFLREHGVWKLDLLLPVELP
jgi:hypothetical protein